MPSRPEQSRSGLPAPASTTPRPARVETLLHDVRRTDPVPLLGAAALLAAVALLAAWVPARGATRVDPLDTLRAD